MTEVTEEKTGSQMAADELTSGMSDATFETFAKEAGILTDEGVVKEPKEIEDRGDDEDDEEHDADSSPTTVEGEDKDAEDEESEEDETEGEEASTEEEEEELSEEEKAELDDARLALMELGFDEEQLSRMSNDSLLRIGTRAMLRQQEESPSTPTESEPQKPAFDLDGEFAKIEGLTEYMGEDQAKAFKGLLSSFLGHVETRAQEAQRKAAAAAQGERVIAEQMGKLRETFPKLKAGSRLERAVLHNVKLLADADKHPGDPGALFRKAALMEGLTEGSLKPKARARHITNGSPETGQKVTGKREQPRTADQWGVHYTTLRHEKGLSDAQARRRLGRRPR
jgi:cobalamin biosynthesis protein CobT